MASRDKGFWFLVSAYIGAAALAYVVLVLLLGMTVELYGGLLGISMLLSVPLVLLLQWLWRKKYPRVEDTDEREKSIRGKARWFIPIALAGCVVWELAREITVRILHGRERRRGED